MKIISRLVLFVLAFEYSAHSTGQISDVLVYNNKNYALNCNPLEQYFKAHPNKKPRSGIISSALWRGYQATFEIKDSLLLVKDIEIEYSLKGTDGNDSSAWKSVLSEVFPDSLDRFCTFYSGLLILPEGELISYVHMGYASLFENYILIRINQGVFQRSKIFSAYEYKKFKKRQFEAYKQTNEYKEELARLTKDGSDVDDIEEFLFIYDVDYSNRFLIDDF